MKHNIIPAGIRLTVTSWENDADNYRTTTISGLSYEKAAYLVGVCKLLRSRHSRGGFGNLYEPSDLEIENLSKAISIIIDKYPTIKEDFELLHQEHVDDTAHFDYASEDLYELGLVGGEFFTRVCDSFVVEFIPEAIVIEDITDSFK